MPARARKGPDVNHSPLWFRGILPIERSRLGPDILAGITLAAVNIPQAMGYTKIAGTPAVTGLYTLLLPVVAFAILGASRYLVVAADSATAAILAVGIAPLAAAGSAKYLALASMVALLAAGLLLLARLLRLGFLADFLSRTVLIGFLTGVGFQGGIAVLGPMLGIPVASHKTAEQLWTLDENRDLLGLCAADAAAAVSGTFVVNGSPTQTAMLEASGGSSQISHLTTASVVAVVLLLFTGPLRYLPVCALGAIVLVVAVHLVDVRGLADIYRKKPKEFVLAIITTATVVLVGVEQGIVLALVLSLLQHVRRSYIFNSRKACIAAYQAAGGKRTNGSIARGP